MSATAGAAGGGPGRPLPPALLLSLALVAAAAHLGAWLGGASFEHLWELALWEGARAAGTAWEEVWREGKGGGPLYQLFWLSLRDAGLPALGIQGVQAAMHLGMLAAWALLAPARIGQTAALLAGLLLALNPTPATRLLENSVLIAFVAPVALALMPRSAREAPARWLAWGVTASIGLHLSLTSVVLWLPLAVPLLRRDGATARQRGGLALVAAAAAAAALAHELPAIFTTFGALATAEDLGADSAGRALAAARNLGHPLLLVGAVAALIPGPAAVERAVFGIALAAGWLLPAVISAPNPLDLGHATVGITAALILPGMVAAHHLGRWLPRGEGARAGLLLAPGLAAAAALAVWAHQPDLPGEGECPVQAAVAVLEQAEARGLWVPGRPTEVHGVKARCLSGLARWEARRRGTTPGGELSHLLATRFSLSPASPPPVRGVHLMAAELVPLPGGERGVQGGALPAMPAGKVIYLGVQGPGLLPGLTLATSAGTLPPLFSCGFGQDRRDCADEGAYLVFPPPPAGALTLRGPRGAPPPRLLEALALEQGVQPH